MVVVAIVAILAALAAPSFQGTLERWRVNQAVESMKSSLYYARSEAIRRGGRIAVAKNTNGSIENCTAATANSAWNCGWFVFVDNNGNGTFDAGEATLQIIPPPNQVNITHNGSGSTAFRIDRWGQVTGLDARGFTFTPVSSTNSQPTTLCVSGSRIKAATNSAACP